MLDSTLALDANQLELAAIQSLESQLLVMDNRQNDLDDFQFDFVAIR